MIHWRQNKKCIHCSLVHVTCFSNITIKSHCCNVTTKEKNKKILIKSTCIVKW